MRTSLLPGLLDMLRKNTLKQTLDARLFEMAKIFVPEAGADLPREEEWLAGVMYGGGTRPSWHWEPEEVDFYDLKGVVEKLLEGLRVRDVSFTTAGLPTYCRYGAAVLAGGETVGWLGELLPTVAERLDLGGKPLVFLLHFEALCVRAEPFPLYTPLPKYPAVYRDMALVLPADVPGPGCWTPCTATAPPGWRKRACSMSMWASPSRRTNAAWPSISPTGTRNGPSPTTPWTSSTTP